MQIMKRKDRFSGGLISASRKTCRKSVAAHGHDFFEIELVIAGSGVYVIDGKSYPIEPQTLFLLNPSQFHEVHSDMELINVMFSCARDGDFFDLPLQSDGDASVFRLSNADYAFFLSLLSELTSIHEADQKYAVLLLRCILRKLTSLLPQDTAKDSASYVRNAKHYVLQNFRGGITLESTAAYLGLSAAYLSDLFVKQTGGNFKVYLDDVRFGYAANLLTLTAFSVSEVCEKAGFFDYANFSRRFKQRYGCSPGQYRRQQEGSAPSTQNRQ